MSTSDSEAFESADEEFIGEVPDKSHSAKINAKNDNVVETSEKPAMMDEGNKLSCKVTEKRKERPQRQPVERKPKQAMKLGVKVADKSIKVASVDNKSKEIPQPEPESQELSDNDWDDFDVETKTEDSKPSLNIASKFVQPQEKQKEDKKEEDGWDDGFEDWDEPQSHISPECSAQHSDTDYRALADRLSSLGDSGAPSSKAETPSSGGWGGWGGWGANLLSSSVSQLTSHVSQGFTTVSNVIESGMGVPDPEELVRIQKASRERLEQEQQSKPEDVQHEVKQSEEDSDESRPPQESTDGDQDPDVLGVFKLGKLVSSVTKLVETTGTAVVSGGLDTLEEIGKRTMRVIQGDEPGGRVRLSTLLREARDRVDEAPVGSHDGDKRVINKAPRFEALFDDFQGLVYLEALEMLSKQCDMKIQTLLNNARGTELLELKETLAQVKEICELPDPDDEDEDNEGKLDLETLKNRLQEATKDLGVSLSFENILKCWDEILTSVKPTPEGEEGKPEGGLEELAEELSHGAMSQLARCSALSVQLLQKATALMSIRDRRSTADEADGLTQLTAVLSSHIGEVAAVYSQKIAQQCGNSETVNEFITNIFLEARKGSSYLQDAFLLTIPILQIGAT